MALKREQQWQYKGHTDSTVSSDAPIVMAVGLEPGLEVFSSLTWIVSELLSFVLGHISVLDAGLGLD